MNKIIPFNKDIKFNESIGEVVSIALDDNLSFKDSYTITGELRVRGSHKYNGNEEDFSYSLPTSIALDSKYDTSKSKISVDDFYYEIVNDNILKVKIDLILDDLFYKEEKLEPLTRDVIADVEKIDEEEIKELEDNKNEEVTDDNKKENNVTDLFKENPLEKEYSVYRVYLVSPDDTLDKILSKYKITNEELGYYNDLDNLKPGIKLIIPSVDE